mgnify:CR=1 FL=1|jgi:hypothetical protein
MTFAGAAAVLDSGPYRHLAMRPEKRRQQPYLRGRTMTVGQLMATLLEQGMELWPTIVPGTRAPDQGKR